MEHIEVEVLDDQILLMIKLCYFLGIVEQHQIKLIKCNISMLQKWQQLLCLKHENIVVL